MTVMLSNRVTTATATVRTTTTLVMGEDDLRINEPCGSCYVAPVGGAMVATLLLTTILFDTA